MEYSETHFCKQCQNMTFLYTDEDKNLIPWDHDIDIAVWDDDANLLT